MQEYGVAFCLAPGCALQRTPFDAVSQESWSEDPVLTGLCALFFCKGVQTHGAAIPAHRYPAAQSGHSRLRLRDIYALPFEIAAARVQGSAAAGLYRQRGSPR